MNPEMEKNIFALAGEYALGTLEGEELRQFQAALRSEPKARDALAYWENRLGAWSLAAPPMDPPRRVWNAIELKMDQSETKGGLLGSFWENIRIWRPVALVAVVAAVALFFFYRQPTKIPTPLAPPMVALLGAEDQPPQFLFATYSDQHKAMVRVLRPMEVPKDKSLELWMVPGEGKVPISWGLLPNEGEMAMPLAENKMPYVQAGAVFAVSMEPLGGSKQAGPSGPVIYQGKLQKI